jgi:hypothetical protein
MATQPLALFSADADTAGRDPVHGPDPVHRRAARGNLPVKSRTRGRTRVVDAPRSDPLQLLQVVKISLPDAFEERHPFLATIGDDRSVEML